MVSYLLNRGPLPKQMINRAGRRSFPTFPQRAGSKILKKSKWSLKWSVIWGSQQNITGCTLRLMIKPGHTWHLDQPLLFKKKARDQLALSMDTAKCVLQPKSHCLFKLSGRQRGLLMWERQISVRLCLLCTERNSAAPLYQVHTTCTTLEVNMTESLPVQTVLSLFRMVINYIHIKGALRKNFS